jgi:hypothetical protein
MRIDGADGLMTNMRIENSHENRKQQQQVSSFYIQTID